MRSQREARRLAAAMNMSPFSGQTQFFKNGTTAGDFQRASQTDRIDPDDEPNGCARFASRVVCGCSALAVLLVGLLMPLLIGLGVLVGALAFSDTNDACMLSHVWNTKVKETLLVDQTAQTTFPTCDVCSQNGTMPAWVMLKDACSLSLVNGLLCEPKYAQRAPHDLLKLCLDQTQLDNLQDLQRCRVQRVTKWMKTKILFVSSQGTAQTVLYTDGLLLCVDDLYFTLLETRLTGRSPDVDTNPRPPPFPPNASPFPASPPATLKG